MKGGKKGLIENSQSLCKHPGAATVQIDAQSRLSLSNLVGWTAAF